MLDLSCPSSAAAAARARCGGAADALKGAFTYYIPPTGGAERNHECSNIRPPITASGWWICEYTTTTIVEGGKDHRGHYGDRKRQGESKREKEREKGREKCQIEIRNTNIKQNNETPRRNKHTAKNTKY